MHVLLTGGLGFIGSHVAVLLGDSDHKITILDNLSNSSLDVYDKILSLVKNSENLDFKEGNVLNENDLENVFENNKIDIVIHFASLKAVGESIDKPLLYYNENLNGLITLLKTMEKHECNKFIYSSSATVYGNQKPPLIETFNTGMNITNPYGQTKYFQEIILKDYINVRNNMEITILRYFNPVGAHPSGLIGENPSGIPNNLFPYILRVASGKYQELSIYGNDLINLKLSLMFPEQYNTRLQPASIDFIAFVTKSYFKAFIDISSDNSIPLNFNFFLITFFIIFLENVTGFLLSRFMYKM